MDLVKNTYETGNYSEDNRKLLKEYLEHREIIYNNLHTISFEDYRKERNIMLDSLWKFFQETNDLFMISLYGMENVITERFPNEMKKCMINTLPGKIID